MTNLSSLEPRDVYLATNSDAYGWGGGLSSLSALGAELHRLGHSTLILGTRNVSNVASQLNPATPRLNLDSGVPRLVWRARNWCVPRALSRSLRRLPPPRLAFVGVSPFWVIAAKRIWPTVPVVFLFAALLSNCLPFTWRRRLGFWQRIDFAGIRRAEHLALSLADQTFTPTRQAHEEVLAFHPAARGRVAVCTYSCEPQDLDEETRAARRRALRLSEDAMVLLAVGVCDLNKAFDLAVREVPAMDERVHLVIVGDGPERDGLADLARDLDIVGRVRFAVPRRDVSPWYAAADCVVSTSLYETLGYTLLEGMCFGRPAIVPRHDPPRVYAGFSEIITTYGGGLLYDRTRKGALAECVNRLARDPHARNALGRQAFSISRRHFNWDSCLDHLLGRPTGSPAEPRLAGAAMQADPEGWSARHEVSNAGERT